VGQGRTGSILRGQAPNSVGSGLTDPGNRPINSSSRMINNVYIYIYISFFLVVLTGGCICACQKASDLLTPDEPTNEQKDLGLKAKASGN
jgi:hypothetical protein